MSATSAKRRAPQRRSIGPQMFVGLIAVIVAAGGGTWWVLGKRATAYPLEISVAEAASRRAAGAVILDVRQPEEWVEAHVPGAMLIPLGELANRTGEVPRGGEIVVVCRSGNRSQEGRDLLRGAGFARVTSMAGGLQEWAAAGLPTVRGP